MSHATLTPLHVWSGYSRLRGPTSLERLVSRAAELGHPRLALTDVNNLYGAPRFHRLAAEEGVAPIIGADLRGADGQAVALVAGDAGYENLCRLITRAHRDDGDAGAPPGPPALADADGLPARSEGLYLIVADAALAGRLLDGGVEPSRLYVGVDGEAQVPAVVRGLVRVARQRSLKLVATGQALFARADDHEVARLLAAMRCGATFDSVPPGELPPAGAHLRGAEQLARSLADLPDAAANNARLAEECSAWRLLPRAPVFPRFECGGEDPPAMLRRLCREGIARRYGRPDEAIDQRLEKELFLIDDRGFAEYFLVVWDIVQYARRRGVPVAGRGSGASSLVAYLLGITNVCPLAFDIPFERFLNERRADFPDLDIDFCWRIRDHVIDYALDRWGRDHAAMVCTHNTFQERSAFRETAKAFGLSDEQISNLDRADLDDAGQAASLAEIARLSRRLLGLLHNLSVHPGGIVIAPGPLDRHVPLQPAPKGVLVTQYDKDGVEDIGLVKLDLLGNRSLSTIRCACDLIARHEGRTIDIESLPADDGPTVATLQAADTVGCNQIESPAMRHLLLALRPDGPRGLMKALALIRPGAASIGMKEAFIRRQRGLEGPIGGYAPADEVLADTHGIMLYEDDVMLVAAAMLGADLAEADRFRKAVQKCRTDAERIELSREFLGRCRSRGVPDDYARSMWVQMAKFNSYSFCRAHAASYAVLAYASAWLKTHYPLEYWAAGLNNNQSMYHPRVYVEQAKRGGVGFLLPDANRSGAEFAVDGRAIRVGLDLVDGLGPAGIETILSARREGAFVGLTDLLARTGLGRDQARALVLCGALDFTARSRPALMIELNLFFSLRPHREPGQAMFLSAGPTIPHLPDDYSPTRKYADERKVLGISVREHIMAVYRPALAGAVDTDSRQLPDRVGRPVRIAGVVEAQRTARTQSGRTMMFLTMDDEFGLFEATVFPNAYAALGTLDRYGPWIISGRVEQQYGSITVTADSVAPHAAKVA